MKRPSVVLTIALLLGCGTSPASPSNPSQSHCDTTTLDQGPQNPADLQSSATFEGRHDSGLDAFFGSDSADIFAQADQLLTGAAQDAAGQLSVNPGDPDLPVASCGNALRSGLDAGVVHAAYRDLGLNLAMAVLATFIDQIPIGAVPTVVGGYKENTAGDPSIKANVEVTVGGSGNSTISVEARETLNIVSSKAGSIQETTVVHIDLDVCPDAGGKVRGMVSLHLNGTSSPAGGGTGTSYDLSVHNDFVYAVNDSAEVASLQISGGAAYTSTGSQTNNVAAQATQTSDVGLRGADPTLTVITDDGSPEAEILVGKNLLKPGDYVAVIAADPARKKWRGGTCVEVGITPPTNSIRPGQKLHLTASVRQKFQGTDLQVPVVAVLDGSGVLTPGSDPVTAPAGYDYQGGQPGEMGRLAFTTTSNRGIGSKSVTLTVCATCGWKGTVTIDASGAVDTSLDVGNYTGSDHLGATYNGSFSVEADADGNLHGVSGSASGSFTHTLQKHGSGKTSGCSWTLDETTNGSATGSAKVMPGDGTGQVSAFDGQYEVDFAAPAVAITGSSDDNETTTETSDPGVNCAPGGTMDTKMPLDGVLSGIYIRGTGSYDPANPVLGGSNSSDGSLLGVPVTVHATWSLQ